MPPYELKLGEDDNVQGLTSTVLILDLQIGASSFYWSNQHDVVGPEKPCKYKKVRASNRQTKFHVLFQVGNGMVGLIATRLFQLQRTSMHVFDSTITAKVEVNRGRPSLWSSDQQCKVRINWQKSRLERWTLDAKRWQTTGAVKNMHLVFDFFLIITGSPCLQALNQLNQAEASPLPIPGWTRETG